MQASPFILRFLSRYQGATCGTTSGTWDHIDAADRD